MLTYAHVSGPRATLALMSMLALISTRPPHPQADPRAAHYTLPFSSSVILARLVGVGVGEEARWMGWQGEVTLWGGGGRGGEARAMVE
jgi:hypothetical protein